MHYREIPPPPRLARSIECFWSLAVTEHEPPHRVMPDGCADIIFTRSGSTAAVEAVGPMTGYRDFALAPGTALVGVRFRPGMWTAQLGISGDRLTDVTLALDNLWGARAGELRDRLGDVESVERQVRVLEQSLPAVEEVSPLQCALEWMDARHGCVSIDDLADQAGLSARQLRRACLARTGLTPKFLARVLRFRHARERLHAHPCALAHVALDCGYYDQAHFTNEFRELSGCTPAGRPEADRSPADGRLFR